MLIEYQTRTGNNPYGTEEEFLNYIFDILKRDGRNPDPLEWLQVITAHRAYYSEVVQYMSSSTPEQIFAYRIFLDTVSSILEHVTPDIPSQFMILCREYQRFMSDTSATEDGFLNYVFDVIKHKRYNPQEWLGALQRDQYRSLGLDMNSSPEHVFYFRLYKEQAIQWLNKHKAIRFENEPDLLTQFSRHFKITDETKSDVKITDEMNPW